VNDPHSERLYYADPHQTRFEARVVQRLQLDGQPAVVLDRTAFYPTSGGQPCDTGELSAVPVLEVREIDSAIVHLLADPLPVDRVVGKVDWARRFDHMQQHSGQHLLSAACERLLDADTVSFHLGSELSTIDLDRPRLALQAMWPVEERVNRIIWENRPVTSCFVTQAEVDSLSLRRPPQVEGRIRLVEVEDFDLNPCGGTHVTRSGEIGLLKIVRLDYRGDETRVEFLCGGRALWDYRVKNETLLGLAATLTVGYWELDEAVARLQEELKTARRALRDARECVLDETVARWLGECDPASPLRMVLRVEEGWTPGELRGLARRLADRPDTVALLGAPQAERVHLCVARSEDVSLDAAAVLQSACQTLGGKGGGQPRVAQGSAPLTEPGQIERALEQAFLEQSHRAEAR